MKRLFIGIPISEEATEKLNDFATPLKQIVSKARFVDSENFHITLAFIGEVPDAEVKNIEEKLTQVSGQKFTLEFDRVILKGKMIWAKFHDQPEFTKLSNEIRELLRLHDEKEQIPHITVARLKFPIRINFGRPEIPKITAEEFKLYESTLTPGGSQYKVIATFTLNA